MAEPPAQSPRAFPWELTVFPLLELGFFIGSVIAVHRSPPLAAALLLAAALSLSFSIHIFFHECVHRRARYPQWFNCVASGMIGLPFDGYRIHHYNHHVFENGPRDFSSTWRSQGDTRTGYSASAYALGWPRQLIAGVKCKTPFGGSPDSAIRIKARIPPQKLALLLTLLIALSCGWQALLLYVSLIYLGWVFTSLHNYGQHLPLAAASVTTYANVAYNVVFFNNGLHWEHHASPGVPWRDLALNEVSHRVAHPHMITPLLPTRETDIGTSIRP